MPIIDAHLHLGRRPWFDQSAAACGDVNTLEFVQSTLARCGVAAAVAMGSGEPLTGSPSDCLMDLDGLYPDEGCPAPFWTCAGVSFESLRDDTARVMEHLQRCARLPRVAGFKLYPGYQHFYVSDPVLEPLYDLAADTGLPVVTHTGDTVSPRGKVKYSHPLTVDDAAADHPKVRFVLAHMGYPWFADAAEVVYKNENVFADLSGLAEGHFSPETFLVANGALMDYLVMWLGTAGWDKVMYGTDWPLVRMEDYLELMRLVVPTRWHDDFFYRNALRVFPRLGAALGQQP